MSIVVAVPNYKQCGVCVVFQVSVIWICFYRTLHTVVLSNLVQSVTAYLLFTEINMTFLGYCTRSDRGPGV